VRSTICKKFALEYFERAFQDYPCTVSDADQELTIRLQQGEIEMREGEERHNKHVSVFTAEPPLDARRVLILYYRPRQNDNSI